MSYYLERARNRAVYNIAASRQQGFNQAIMERNPEALTELVVAMQSGMSYFNARSDIQTFTQVGEEILEQYHLAHAHPDQQGITLGWEFMDAVTGGAQPGDVITVVGRIGEGKSYTIARMAIRAWMQGRSVALVSMEMTNQQIGRRLIGCMSGLNPRLITHGQLSMFNQDVLYQTVEGIQFGAPFHLISGGLRKTVREVDAVIQEFSPDIVFIDASYLLQPETKGRRARWENIAEVGEEIRALALDRETPIVQSVQFNREAKNARTPDMVNIAGSDVIPQVSTVVAAVRKGTGGYENTRRRYRFIKVREAECPPVDYVTNYLFDPVNFDWLPEETETDGGGRAAAHAAQAELVQGMI